MAARGETTDDVLHLALEAGRPAEAMARAEQHLIARRAGPPDVAGAVGAALALAGPEAAPSPIARAALDIAAAVERHGAAFPPGREPAYHDRHHQAEAALAMGWLAGAARRRGLIDGATARLAVAAMAAHDLLHDGQVHGARGLLERRSAEAADAIATAAGAAPGERACLRRIILATTWPWQAEEAPDLCCHLAREADLFGSTMPLLGPRLGRLLAAELAAAGQPAPEGVASHAARVALLRLLPEPTASARALGLDGVRAAQIAAYAGAARRLGIDPPGAEAGAAALDAMDAADAEAVLAWAGSGP